MDIQQTPICYRFAEYGHQSPLRRDPPKYSPTLRRCEFCNTRHLEPFYLEHLISTHAHRIFYCDECNRYKEKKDFMSHMSNHASQYTTKIKKVMKKNTNVQNKTETSVNQDNTSSGLATNKLDPGLTTAPSSQEQKTSKNNQTDDFSDHSDTEYGFGPLPESVFEAIEDSQDNQPETESVSDETNRLTPPAEKVTKKLHKKSRTCPICSKVYTASSSYFYHMKYTHKRIKEHECSICAKKFATRASLTTHTTTHTGECQFECKDCKKRFKSKASLYIHEQTHNGIKTWSCSQCNAAFRWRTHLLRHMKRHSSEKAHVCTTCGRRFNVRCDLLRHARTHAAGNYSCDKCNAKFAQVRYLKVHMNKKHSCNVTS